MTITPPPPPPMTEEQYKKMEANAMAMPDITNKELPKKFYNSMTSGLVFDVTPEREVVLFAGVGGQVIEDRQSVRQADQRPFAGADRATNGVRPHQRLVRRLVLLAC